MAKTRAPLLSFGASGQIGKTAVYAKWRGVPYVRERVIPANPRTTAQTANRNRFAAMRELWKIAPSGAREPWDAYATGRPFTGMNAYVGENNRALVGESTMAEFIASPGAGGGFPAEAMDASTGAGSGVIDVAFTMPSVPDGWSPTAAAAVAFLAFDPTDRVMGQMFLETAEADPWELSFENLEPAEEYLIGGWVVWEKPNGRPAYSVGITDLVTSGA